MQTMPRARPHAGTNRVLQLLQRSANGFGSLFNSVRRLWRPRQRSSRLDSVATSPYVTTLEPLVGLQLDGGNLSLAALESVARQRTLRKLKLKDVEVVDSTGLEFLRRMKNLEELVIDNCPELMSESLRPLASLSKLKRLSLGVGSLSRADLLHLAMCEADVSLTLRGLRNLTELEWPNATLNAVELRFEGFGQTEFPFWLTRVSTLRCLSFHSGAFSGQRFRMPAFPESLRSLSIVNCKIGYPLLNCLLKSSGSLTDVELCLTTFHEKVNIEFLQNVRTLKIYGEKELDGEILGKISQLHNLEELHIAGCLSLKEHHLAQLKHLPNLACLCLGSCYLRGGGCEVLFSLRSLSQLTFNSCCGLTFQRLNEATALLGIRIVKCLNVDVDFLFSASLPEHLNDFKYEPNV